MILIKHELKQGWKSLAVWTASIGFFYYHLCVPVSGNEGRNGRHERNVLLYGSL